MKNLPLHWKIIIGLVAGIIYSLVSSALGWNEFTKDWIDPFGVIFIRLLKFIAVPLVLFSIIGGVAGLPDPSKLGRMGAKTLVAYVVTTVAAVTVGLVVVNLLQPGGYIDEGQRVKNRLKYELWAESTPGGRILDGQRYLSMPEYADLVEEAESAMAAELNNQSVEERMKAAEQFKEAGPMQFLVDFVPDNIFAALTDSGRMLQIIFFGIFFGVMLLLIPAAKAQPVRELVDSVNEVFLKMVEVVMEAAPFFVFALMAGVISKMASTPAEVIEIFKGLLSYSVVVFLGLAFMVFVFYPALISILVRKISYGGFFRRISPAQFLAFSTSSSAATLPVTMECVRDNIGVSQNVTNFVLPIGATVNMDGTSLYQAVAVVFLAQMHLVDLTLGQQVTIVLTATLASIGSAAVPSAGLVMMIVVLQSVGLNPAWIAIVFPVDRILDMCRTVVNVTGDATVSTLIAKSENELDVKAPGALEL
ncbi:dicarboxylate/amino acid:cation symporter [Phaeodactylibacter luteus]|uniref:Dicarboxylate/amino acid:cation symporter n=1 Tax=Phaeodactylibacter luteus TaxID=1564516 RepID=A0A5C6S6C3_9BACT|nr:dicarboxylate/amino acid:cation symporter [Phaeodactylibacter luteus]